MNPQERAGGGTQHIVTVVHGIGEPILALVAYKTTWHDDLNIPDGIGRQYRVREHLVFPRWR